MKNSISSEISIRMCRKIKTILLLFILLSIISTTQKVFSQNVVSSSSHTICKGMYYPLDLNRIIGVNLTPQEGSWYDENDNKVSNIFIPPSTGDKTTYNFYYKIALKSAFCNLENDDIYSVTINIGDINAPLAFPEQIFCARDAVYTLEDINISGTNIKWYDDASGGAELLPTTVLTDNRIYYASQSNDFCGESTSRTAVRVVLPDAPELIITDPDLIVCVDFVDITAEDITLGSTPSLTLSYWQNASATTELANPQAVTSGTYYIKAEDINNCWIVKPINVVTNGSITVTATASYSTLCEGEEIILKGTGADNYVWNNQVEDGVAFVPPVGTTDYIVTGIDSNGCSDKDTISINVYEQPYANILGENYIKCDNNATQLLSEYVNDALTYQWSTDDGSIISRDDDSSIWVNKIGTYQLVVGYENSLCSDTALIEVISNPQLEIICPNDTVVYLPTEKLQLTNLDLNEPHLISICEDSIKITNNAPDVYDIGETQVIWKATSNTGEVDTCVQQVTVIGTPRVEITKEADKLFVDYEGEEIVYTLMVTNAGNIPLDDVTIRDTLLHKEWNNITLTPQEDTIINASYKVTLADISRGYIVNQAFVSALASDGTSVKDTASTIIDVKGLADLSILKTIDESKPFVNQEVTFNLLVTNNGPSEVRKALVTDVLPSGYDYVSDDGNGSYNRLTGEWVVGFLKVQESKELNILTKVKDGGDYTNIASVQGDLEDNDLSNNVSSVNPDVQTLMIPEIFSPNGDGIQDYFVIRGIEAYPTARMRIYNRWGNLVYEGKNYGNKQANGDYNAWWDGRSNQDFIYGKDEILPGSTYFYILDLNDGSSNPINGFLFLNR